VRRITVRFVYELVIADNFKSKPFSFMRSDLETRNTGKGGKAEMKKMVLFIAMLGIGISSWGALAWSGPKYLDVIYKTASGQNLKLDIYLPTNTTIASPVVMYTHGGGWTTNDENKIESGYMKSVALNLLKAGVAVVSVQYRLAINGNVIQDCVTDAKDACRFMTKNASKYNINKDKMATFGDSAGGHIALMCALVANGSTYFQGVSELSSYNNFKIVGCVSWYGPVSFRTSDETFWTSGGRTLTGFNPRIFGTETNAVTQEIMRSIVSPIRYYRAGSPPIYLLHGDMDTTIPIAHMWGMKAQATAVGNTNFTYQVVTNAGHNFALAGTAAINPSGSTIVTLTGNKLKLYLK
jgi:acetyl esterase/lipase